MSKLISIAMPVYNGERFIAEAISSVLAQTYTNLELIITDNASTDGTQAICADFARKDPRVRYIRSPRNLGAAPNYNLGFEHARGDYLKWAAHDDRISPNFLEVAVAALEADSTASLAFARTICIDPDGNEVQGPDVDETPAITDSGAGTRYLKAVHMGGTCFPIFGLFRMDMLKRSTLHRSYYGSDRALIAETALQGKLLRVEDAIFYNREHPKRSIRMVDHAERRRWQDTSASRTAAMEHVSLFRHLMEIAGRHPDVASPFWLKLKVLRYGAAPGNAARMGLDLVRYVSPGFAARLRGFALRGKESSV